jgi:RNA polymerase sigma factor (sigma-70 family)
VSEGISSFERFFADQYPRLVGALYLIGADHATGEELAQEALSRAYERWARIQAMASPGGYVFRIALNLYRKQLRRTALARRLHVPSIPDRDPVEEAEHRSALMTALGELPVGQREAIVLVELVGLDASEAGRVLGIEPASVRSRCSRARAALRVALEGSDE